MSTTHRPRGPGVAQLALRFPLNARCQFDNFEAGANLELVQRLQGLDRERPGFRGLLLSGEAGVGKSHLLQAACRSRVSVDAGAMFLPLADPAVGPDALEGLERLALVALDDIDAWLGDAEREAALLALYQGLLAAGGCLLAAAARPARQLVFHYPDLASRLRSLAAYRVQPLDDVGKMRVLARLAHARGLELTRPVTEFWLSRGTRDLAVLTDQLERLDAAAMAAQRRVTVPLLKEVLGL